MVFVSAGKPSASSERMSQPIVSTIRPASVSLRFAAWNASLNLVDPHRQTMVGKPCRS